MYKCNFCNYQSSRNYNLKVHIRNKHNQQTGSGSEPMEQSIPLHTENEKHSNLQEESVEELYDNIDQWQKAYETLKLQYQQEEKVTTCDDGRPSHVSIQLFDKCCKVMNDHINLSRGLQIKKEQQLDRFCTAWEDLKRERDTFGKEINRRDCCGDGYLDERFARKLRRKC